MNYKGKINMSEETLRWLKKNDYTLSNIDLQGNYGNTALMKAAREGNAEIFSELIKLGANIHIKNIDGNTALWLACFGENPEIIKMLINQGIEIDTLNVNGVTPLMYAASSGKEEIVSMLVDAGADVHIKNPDDFSALDLAITPKILRTLQKHTKGVQ
jgi:ankyrin repeat protein